VFTESRWGLAMRSFDSTAYERGEGCDRRGRRRQ
jgi:hypothetical protein